MCIKKQTFIPAVILGLIFSANTLAETVTPEQAPRLELPDEKIQVAVPRLPQQVANPPSSGEQTKSLSISKEQLANYPELVIRALIPALMQNNREGVALLLPIYEQQPNSDPQIVTWGRAIVQQNNKITTAL